jgi:hypothetical protein
MIYCTATAALGLQEKGHANSMNLIFKMAASRYLLYIEDDWLPLPKPLVQRSFLQSLQQLRGGGGHTQSAPVVSLRDILSIAINILKKQGSTVCTDFECLEDRSIVQVQCSIVECSKVVSCSPAHF